MRCLGPLWNQFSWEINCYKQKLFRPSSLFIPKVRDCCGKLTSSPNLYCCKSSHVNILVVQCFRTDLYCTKFHLETSMYMSVCMFVNSCFSCVYTCTYQHKICVCLGIISGLALEKIGPSHQAALWEFDFFSDVVCRVVTSSSLKLCIYPYIYMAIIIVLFECPNGWAIKLPLKLPKNVLFIYQIPFFWDICF